jgi:hypothetical protein
MKHNKYILHKFRHSHLPSSLLGCKEIVYADTEEIINKYKLYVESPERYFVNPDSISKRERKALGDCASVIIGGWVNSNIILPQEGNWFIGPESHCCTLAHIQDNAVIISSDIRGSDGSMIYILDNTIIYRTLIDMPRASISYLKGYTILKNINIHTSTINNINITMYNTTLCCSDYLYYNNDIRVVVNIILHDSINLTGFIFDINESNYMQYLKFFEKYNVENLSGTSSIRMQVITNNITHAVENYNVSLDDFIKYFNN